MNNKNSISMYDLKDYIKKNKSPFKKIRTRQRVILIILIALGTLPFIFFAIWSYISKLFEPNNIFLNSVNIVNFLIIHF